MASLVDPTQLAAHEKKDIKSQRVILNVAKDLIPHVAEKTTTHAMYKGVVDLFQVDNMNWKMILRNKLRDV